MDDSNPGSPSSDDLLYILNHVFLPPKLPQNDVDGDVILCSFAYKASHEFARFISQSQQKKWSIVSQMLKTLRTSEVLDKDALINNILGLKEGG